MLTKPVIKLLPNHHRNTGVVMFHFSYNKDFIAVIKRRVIPHLLRHSFVTHLLEQEIDMRYIQGLPVNVSSKTTEKYAHVSITEPEKIKNPLDGLWDTS